MPSTMHERASEMACVRVCACRPGDVSRMQALLQQKPGLIYAHSKDGENIWHAAAQGGYPEVRQGQGPRFGFGVAAVPGYYDHDTD